MMPLDLSKLAHICDFEVESAALGRIHCGTYTMKVAQALEKLFDKEDLTGPIFARTLLQYIGKTASDSHEVDNGNATEDRSLTAENIAQLTDDEIEKFAREFLAHNAYLMKPDDNESVEDVEAGGTTEEQPGESASDRLLRVMRNYSTAQSIRMKKFLKPFSSFLSKPLFSAPTLDAIQKNALLSSRLDETLSVLRQSQPEYEPIPIPENPTYETNRRLNRVINYLEDMQPLVIESGQLIRSLNDAAIRMLGDFGRSTQRAESFSKIIIAIAAISLVVTAVFFVLSFFDAREGSEDAKQFTAAQNAQFEKLITSQNDRFEQLFKALGRESQLAQENLKKTLDALIQSQQAELNRRSEADRKWLPEVISEALKKIEQGAKTNGSSDRTP